ERFTQQVGWQTGEINGYTVSACPKQGPLNRGVFVKRISHDLTPRINAQGDAAETRQCAEIKRRAPAAAPKCGVSDSGCELLVADDLTGLTYVVRPSPSELDHHVLHLRRCLGRGCHEGPPGCVSSCGKAAGCRRSGY